MANFGGAKYVPGQWSPTTDFFGQSITAGLPRAGGGQPGINTPEEALERRPYMNVGKSSLGLFPESPTVMAPTSGPVPMPDRASIGIGPKKEMSPVDMLGHFIRNFVVPVAAPGVSQGLEAIEASNKVKEVLEGDDEVLKRQWALWVKASEDGLVDSAGMLSGFFEQYEKITAIREGRSAELTQSYDQGMANEASPQAVVGAATTGLIAPMMYLQQNFVRWLGEGNNPTTPDRVEQTMATADELLTPELVNLKKEFAEGNLNEDEFRDMIVLSGFAITNPDPLGPDNPIGNAAVSLGLELLTDPLNWPTLGAAGLARTSTVAAGRSVLPNVMRAVVEDGVEAAAKSAGDDLARFVGTAAGEEARRVAGTRVAVEIEAMVQKMKPNLAPKARTDLDRVEAVMALIAENSDMTPSLMKGLKASGATGAFVTRAPKVIKLGYAIDKALDPLTLFNRNRGGERARLLTSRLFGEGYFDALGWLTVNSLDNKMKAAGVGADVIERLDGTAAMNYALQVGNEQNIRHALKKQGIDPNLNPTAAARETVERSGNDARKLMREHVDRTLEVVVAGSRGGKGAAMAEARARAERQLMNMGASAEAAKAAAKSLDERELRALAVRHWAHIITELDKAIKEAVAIDPKFGDEMISRVTNLGPNQMTANDLKAVLKAARLGGKSNEAIVLDAVARFDDLRFNINQSLEPEEVLAAVLKLGEKLKGTLPTAITDTSILPKSLAKYLDEYGPQGYRIGLRPDDAHLAVPHLDEVTDEVLGVSSWIDNVTEGVVAKRVGRAKAWQETLFRTIGGSEIERNAARRFTQFMADELGLAPAESREIMRSLKEVAEINSATPRSLNGANVSRALKDARVKGSIKRAIPVRRVTDAIAFAYENEMGRVGATQKFTGKIKTKSTGLWDNWVSWVAESLYPMVRFTKSPIFILQELTEYPYFMSLRGMFPWRHNLPGHGDAKALKGVYDEKTLFLMDYFKTADTFVKTDMIEQSDLVRMGFMASRHIADSNTKLGKVMQTITGSHLYRSKAEAEAVIWRERMGKYLKDAMMEESPATWNAVRAAARKGASDGEVATDWLHDLVARANPDSVWTRHSPEMFRPSHIGRRARVSSQLVGYIVGGEQGADLTWKQLRKRVANPKDDLTTDFVEEQLLAAGADANYAARVRSMLEFPEADDFYKSLLDLGAPPAQVKAMREADELDAQRLGIGLHTYLSERWMDKPQSIDQFGDQQNNFMFQLIVDALDARGLKAPERGAPVLDQLRALGDDKAWHWPDQESFKGIPVNKMTNEQKKADKAWKAREARLLNPEKGKPPKVNGVNAYDGTRHTIGEPTYEQWVKQLEKVFPNVGTRVEMADWYTDMQRGMLALFHGQPDDEQVANAARMIVGFAVTQANTSPADGMQYLYRVLSMARRGEDWPSAIGLTKAEANQMLQRVGGLNQKQLDELLMKNGVVLEDGIGQKLTDFIDSLIGNKTRSVGVHGPDPNRPWGPVAGDVWAKRDMGYLDEKLGNKLHLVIDGVARNKDGSPSAKAVTTIRGPSKKNAEGKVVKGPVIGYRVRMEDGSEKVFEEVGKSVPDQYEYDHIVEFYNGLADHLNGRAYLGKTDWTSADAQAMGWFKAKTVYGDATGDPRSAFFKGRWSGSGEIVPAQGTSLQKVLPVQDMTPESLALVHDEVMNHAVREAAGASGVRLIQTHSSIQLGSDGSIQPTLMVEVLGDRDAAEQYLARQALYSHAESATLSRSIRNQPYDQAAGITGAIEFGVTSKEEGHAILAALAGKDGLPPGAHLVRADNGSYVIRAIWEGTGDSKAFKAQYPAKKVLATLSEAANRKVAKEEVYRPTVEFIRTANNWKERPDGGAYLDIAKRGSGRESGGRRTVQREPDAVANMERVRQHGVVLVAEGSVQRHVPREAAAARTLDLYDDAIFREQLGEQLVGRGAGNVQYQRADLTPEEWAAWDAEYDRVKETDYTFSQKKAMNERPEGVITSTLSDPTPEQAALYRAYMDHDTGDFRPWQAGSCDQVGWSGRYDFPEPCMDVLGHKGQHFWHHMDGKIEVWDEGIPMETLRRWGVETGIQFQRAPTGTRAAIVREAEGRRDQLYLNPKGRAKVREDTILHELVHKFANDLEPSAVRRIKGIRAAAEGHTLGAHGAADTTLTMDDQEWLVEQFLAWAKDPSTTHPTLQPLLEAFRASMVGKRTQARATLHPDVKTLLDEQAVAAGARRATPAHYDVDEEAMFNMAMVGHRRASKDARDLIHFRGERSLVERSMNHPFFGMYPLSYMWGKVLPELTEFLMFRPFGFKAPMVAFNTANRMYQSFMHQQAYDEELRQYLYENEPAMRALSMFIPGVPWDLPVNAPLWARRLVEALMTNQQRELEGKEPLDIDVGKIISDQIGYQIGVARSATTIPQTLEAAVAAPGIIGRALGGDAPLDEGEGFSDEGPFSTPIELPTPEQTPEDEALLDVNYQIQSLSAELAESLPPLQ